MPAEGTLAVILPDQPSTMMHIMKTIITLTIILITRFFVFGQVTIPNANFERLDNSSDIKSSSWTTEGKFDKCVMDSITVWKGKYAMHLTKLTTEGTGRFFQEIPFKTTALKKYKVSAVVKVKNVKEGFAGVSVRAIDGSDKLVCHQNLNMMPEKIKNTQDWKFYEGEFYVTTETVKLKVAGYLWGSGEAWYDNISIQEIPFGTASLTPNIAKYIDEYFAVIEKKSIVRDTTYISYLMKNTELLCKGNSDIHYCRFILKNITFNLNDGHSFFSTPEEWKEMHEGDKNLQRGDATFSSGEIIDGNIAYIKVPTFASIDWELVKKSVDSLQSIIAKLDNQNPKGWIIDLSNNNGGNSFAMFPGLGPLLGNGICGYSFSADGSKMTLIYNEGLAGWGTNLDTLKTNPYHVKNPKLPIAVLYGNQTGSSGEVTALTFRGKENSRSFGQETGGFTTRVDNCVLSDSACINLASGYDADRNGLVFKGTKIQPDVPTKDHDESIKMATEWILNRKE
jgi:hypothetical protein